MTDDPQITSRAEEAKEAKEAKSGERFPESSKSNNAKEAATKIKVEKFALFKQKFEDELESKYFGTNIPAFDLRRDKSAGAKELERSGAKETLLRDSFLHQVHRLLRDRARLELEQSRVHKVAAEMGKLIKKLRNAKQTAKRLQENIISLDKQVANLLSWEPREHLYKAVKELKIVESVLCDIEETRASYIHPELRRKHDQNAGAKARYQIAKFKPLLSKFDYQLDSLKKKAPQQWLWSKLDSQLRRLFRRANKTVTDLTRYRIIMAALKAAGQTAVELATLKEYFAHSKAATGSLPKKVRKSKTT